MNFKALLDTGAAVTAVSARVWQESVSDISPNLDPPNHDFIRTVDGYSLEILVKVMLPFAIGSNSFPFEAHVIPGLTSDVILGRHFSQKICAKIDFDEGMIKFKHGNNPLPFDDSDPVAVDSGDCSARAEFVCPAHADSSFTILPESEIIVFGRLNAELPLKKIVCGLVVPRNDYPQRYSIFGASEPVKFAEDGTIPVRIVNSSPRPVKNISQNKTGGFEGIEDRIETFQLSEAPEESISSF